MTKVSNIKKNMEQTFQKYGTFFDADETQEILERDVTKFGNSAHIPLPLRYLNKKVRIFILREKEEEQKE